MYVQHDIFFELSLKVRGMVFEKKIDLVRLNLVATFDFEKDQFPIQI